MKNFLIRDKKGSFLPKYLTFRSQNPDKKIMQDPQNLLTRKKVKANFTSLIAFMSISLFASACSSSEKLAGLLNANAIGDPIILLPSSPTLSPSSQLLFTATGGKPPYVYSLLIGSGSINPSSGLYSASSNTGTVVVKVTDTLGSIALASLVISSGGAPSGGGPLVISPANKVLALNNTFTFTATGGSTPYAYSIQSGAGVVQALSGTYSATSTGVGVVRVTDAIGLSADASVIINPALALIATQNTVSVNNSTSLTASGGVAPYAYSLASGSGSVTGTTYTAPGTPGGASVQVTDSIGNTSTTFITVNGSLTLSPSAKTLAIGNTFTFSASGGVSPYTYTVAGGGAGGTINSTSGFYTAPNVTGSDTVRVTDGLGNTITSTVSINSALTINPASLTLGLNNTRTFTALGGVSPFTYSIASGVGSINAVSGIYNASATGTAVVRVTDAQGNIANSNVTVTSGLAINVTNSTLSVGNSTALAASGGVSPYTYSLVAGGGAITGTTYTAPASSGTATVRVTDNLGTINDASVTITPALSVSPTARSLTTTNTYTFLATGGVGPYVFTVFSGAGTIGSSSGTYSSIATGSATVRVTDSLNNISNASVTVTAPLAISPSPKTLTITNTTTFSTSGGVVPFTFSILSGGVGTINSTSGYYTAPASAGSATVRATDAIGNTSDSAVTVNANLTLSPATYTLAINNTATFNGLGGVPPYTYTIQSGGGTVNSSGVFTAPASTGTTVVKVTDSAAAVATSTVTVNPALSVTPSAVTISVNNTANLIASGGVSPYSWTTNLGTVSTTGTFTAPASAGIATVTVMDSIGNSQTSTVTINAVLTLAPTSATIAANGVTQNFSSTGGAGGYTYSTTIGAINSATGVLNPPGASGTGTVTVTDGIGNTRTATVTVNAALALTPTNQTLAVTNSFAVSASGGVAPLTYSVFSGGGTISGTTYTAPGTAGSAVVRVTDGIGNVANCNVTVNAALSLTPTSQILAVNNNKTFVAANGVAPYTFSTTLGTINVSGGFYTAPASAGSATVTVTDAVGNSTSATVTINPALVITPATKRILINDVFAFSATGGTGSNAYSILSGSGSISAAGVYTAPATGGTATVRVTDSVGNNSDSLVTTATFATADDFQFTASYASGVNGIVSAGANLFAAGYGNDSTGISHWIVRKSMDAGVTWTTVDNYNYAAGKSSTANFIIANPAGTILYAGGNAYDSTGSMHWLVKSSTDAGVTWTVSDNYAYAATFASAANGAVVMPNGDVLVTGYGSGTNAVNLWITRKLPFGGSWGTVDNFSAYTINYNTLGLSLTNDSAGNLYAGGKDLAYYNFYIRKSADGGTTWTTVYSNSNGNSSPNTGAFSITKDLGGKIYAAGSWFFQNGYGGAASSMALVTSTDSGATWTTVEIYHFPGTDGNSTAANNAAIYGVAIDSSNCILEAGILSDLSTLGHWTVRKRNQTLNLSVKVDDFQLSSTQRSVATAEAILATGKIIVGGYAADAGGVNHWVIRTF